MTSIPKPFDLYSSQLFQAIEKHLLRAFELKTLEPHSIEDAQSITYKFILDDIGLSFNIAVYTVPDDGDPQVFIYAEIALGILEEADRESVLVDSVLRVGQCYLPVRVGLSRWENSAQVLCVQLRGAEGMFAVDAVPGLLDSLVEYSKDLRDRLSGRLKPLPLIRKISAA